MNENELLMKRRNLIGRCQNWGLGKISGQVQGLPVYCLQGIRRTGSMTCIQGNLQEHGNSSCNAKGATESVNPARFEYRCTCWGRTVL